MYKIILKGFDVLKNLWCFLKLVSVFFVMILLLFWIQNLTNGNWQWLDFFTPFMNNLLSAGACICSVSLDLFGTRFELKYIGALIILAVVYYGMNLAIFLTNLMESGYKDSYALHKKAQEVQMNKELQSNIIKEEMSINKYVVTVNTVIKSKFSHNEIDIDLQKHNDIMVNFIESRLGVRPVMFAGCYMYNFNEFSKIDSVLSVFFEVLHSSTPLDYAICIQAGENLSQLENLIKLRHFGKITMAADTSYRYRFNAIHRYQTSQVGIFQNGSGTLEVHEFLEFS